jgi:hypothetical protein
VLRVIMIPRPRPADVQDRPGTSRVSREAAPRVEHFLVEPDRQFLGVDFLHVPRAPTRTALHLERVRSAAVRQVAPCAELALMLLTFSSVHRTTGRTAASYCSVIPSRHGEATGPYGVGEGTTRTERNVHIVQPRRDAGRRPRAPHHVRPRARRANGRSPVARVSPGDISGNAGVLARRRGEGRCQARSARCIPEARLGWNAVAT